MKTINIITLLLAVLWVGCNNTQIETQVNNNTTEIIKKESPREEPIPVISELKPIHCTGIIDILPQHTATVTATVGGFVETINVNMGQWVEKGTLLSTLKHPDYIDMQMEYLSLSSEFEYLKTEYMRQETLHKEKAISEKTYQLTKSNFNTVKAQKAGLSAKLEMLGINPANITASNINSTIKILAPISGYVDHIDIVPGKMITSENDMFDIINVRKNIVRLNVFAQYSGLLETGQEVLYSLNDDETFKATISYIDKSVEQESNTLQVLAKPINQSKEFAIGTYIDAQIIL
ncbi:efflux RND transporter periplasmic adaptor subunit [Saccharicrinis aurantiacus]|uniref:efflux RND transporter periplasmic adaptor subunit n=1 Tax=Saccharicrinis aurantiacus TaxID=1849719 RepID=UPI00248FDC26|nr:efflux RND transporter periplasmic adaptor subunit [Saccharicrinis aurantiacus]